MGFWRTTWILCNSSVFPLEEEFIPCGVENTWWPARYKWDFTVAGQYSGNIFNVSLHLSCCDGYLIIIVTLLRRVPQWFEYIRPDLSGLSDELIWGAFYLIHSTDKCMLAVPVVNVSDFCIICSRPEHPTLQFWLWGLTLIWWETTFLLQCPRTYNKSSEISKSESMLCNKCRIDMFV